MRLFFTALTLTALLTPSQEGKTTRSFRRCADSGHHPRHSGVAVERCGHPQISCRRNSTLAGIAALGFQVNPNLTPARVRAYLVKSATKMPYVQIVNPEAFVKVCREDPDAGPTPKR